MKRKNLLILIESLSGGGAEKVLSTLLQNLELNQFEVTLCCFSDVGKYKEVVLPYVYYTSILQYNTKSDVCTVFSRILQKLL